MARRANDKPTSLSTDDVTVEGNRCRAGTYGWHTIPDKDQWTIIFSKNSTSWGSFSLRPERGRAGVTGKNRTRPSV